MKPHFGQSDAAMNKLAGINQLPNNNKPPDLLRLSGYTKAEHEEAAGMGLEDAFMKQPPCSCVPCKYYEVSLDSGPCVACKNHEKFEPKLIDKDSYRKIVDYKNGFEDATMNKPKRISSISYENGFEDGYEKRKQEEHMIPEPLPEGYYENEAITVCTKSKATLRTNDKYGTRGYVITACFVPREWVGKTVDVVMSLEI